MNEELRNNFEPPISANIGWQEMQALLNKHLPVKREIITRKLLRYYGAAGLLITILVLTSLQSGDNFLKMPASGSALKPSPEIETAGILSTTGLKTNPVLQSGNLPGNINSFKKSDPHSSFSIERVLPADQNRFTSQMAFTGKETSKEEIINNMMENQGRGTILPPVSTSSFNPTKPAVNLAGKNVNTKGTWNLYGGIGMNTNVYEGQDLQPYPFAEARYNLTPRYYLAAGISAWSPVATSASGVSKSFYLSDTNNNLHLYNEITNYSRFHYADIPLTAGAKITKNISIQSGIQISVLLHKKNRKIVEPYDFQMTNMASPVSFPVLILSPNTQKEYDVQVHNIDYRFIAGIRYALNKTTVGLVYQHGLRSLGSGTLTNKQQSFICVEPALSN